MQKSPSDNQNHSSSTTHHTLQRSSTLNRRYVARPGSYYDRKGKRIVEVIDVSAQPETATFPEISHYAHKISVIDSSEPETLAAAPEPADLPPAENPYQSALEKKKTKKSAHTPTAKELKNFAINQALESVAAETPAKAKKSHKSRKEDKRARKEAIKAAKKQAKLAKQARKRLKSPHRGRRFALAFSCAAACVAVIGYFIYTNAPDLSVRVAAIQTGIDAKYPSYTPRDYQMSSVSTDADGHVLIEFAGPDNNSYTLTEEKSTWDSNAVLSNYVKPNWKDNYDTIREQGITIYISGSDAVWVNGGIFYQLDASAGNLTKKQIKTIVTSL